MSKLNFFLLTFLFLSYSLGAQSIFDTPHDRYDSSISTTQINFPNPLNKRATITKPPGMEVRPMAEWEEIDAITITWARYFETLAEIVKYAQIECKVYINCASAEEVRQQLDSYGVAYGDNVIFLENQVFDSVWIRDYGPNSAYLNNVDSLIFVDWIYNRSARPADDILPASIAEHIDVPLFETSEGIFHLTATGGNFMSDGIGKAFSSKLIINENKDITEEDIDQIMLEFMGVKDYTKFDKLQFDGIHHIDMHMKLLDEERFIFGEYPDDKADHDIIEANIEYLLANTENAYGEPYEIIRIPMPPDFNGEYPSESNTADFRTYTNALFINRMILVPTYQTKYDTTALRIWRETMPGYNVIGIRCNSLISAFGAIHCVTKEIGVRDPLRIVYQKIKNQEKSNASGYLLNATIQHRSGIKSAFLHYRSKGDEVYEKVEMEFTDFQADLYSASIPNFTDQGVVEYYVQVTANSGKSISRPIPAPEAYYSFNIQEKSNATSSTLGNAFVEAAFPNPSNGLVCIPISLAKAITANLALYNVHGKLIEVIHEGKLNAGSSKHFLNVAAYPSGLYTLRLTNRQDVYTQKLVVE